MTTHASTTGILRSVNERLAHFDYYTNEARELEYPYRSFSLIRELGWLGLPLEAAFNPLIAGDRQQASSALYNQLDLLQHIGRGSLPAGRIYEGHVNALHLIDLYGSAKQIQYWHDTVHQSQHLFGIWNTGSQDDVEMFLSADEQSVWLKGSKTFCSGAGQVDQMIITGQLYDSSLHRLGWQMIVVPLTDLADDRIDRQSWNPSGMEASASYKVDFTDLTLDRFHLLGQPDEYHKQPAFSGGAVRFAAVHLGGAYTLLEHTRTHLREQNRVKHPYQQHRLAKMATLITSGQQWLSGAAEHTLYEYNTERAVIEYANMVRTAISDICHEVVDLAQASIGVQCRMQAHPAEAVIRDLRTYLRQPNPDGALASLGEYVGSTEVSFNKLW